MSRVVTLSNLGKKRIVQVILATVGFLTLAIIVLFIWVFRLDSEMSERLTEGRFAPAVEFYAAPDLIRAGFKLPASHMENFFRRARFVERSFGKSLEPGEFSVWNGNDCLSVLPQFKAATLPQPSPTPSSEPIPSGDPHPENTDGTSYLPPALSKCVAFVPLKPLPVGNETKINQGDAAAAKPEEQNRVQIVAFLEDSRTVAATFTGAPPEQSDHAALDPELFAQYYGDRPILRDEIPLSYTPAACLNALLAIEDSNFLEHDGVSFTGVIRAGLSLLQHGHITQGGSTITQQLVKNYFLSDERTFKRKITEMAMALLLEHKLAKAGEGEAFKDKILELYINTIYMGQNGVFEVRGFGAAARHYFGADLRDLNLPQCALLAAVLNGPGVYDPFTKPEKALQRRTRVLDRMVEVGNLSLEEAEAAKQTPLPKVPQRGLTEPAPYFVQTVRRQFKDEGVDESAGLRVYTTLNLRAQEAAYQAVRAGLERLETNNKLIKKIKEKGKNLEAVLLSSDPSNGYVTALVGGRGFKRSPYNRAFDSHRQVGSVMKPFVYLTALEKTDEDGNPFTPISILSDEATTHKWEGQSWTPRNYDGKFNGSVPMYWALKESLNAATAWLGMRVGLSDIIDTTRRLGVKSKIQPLPSLSLGAFELFPWEVLQAYGSLAHLGEFTPVTFVIRIESLGGEILFQHQAEPEQVVSREAATQLVGIMKNVMLSGTARFAYLSGFTHPSAGKTGTTNDKKDAWFAGFTPNHTAVVWVGYDDNTSHGLTGASGAVPIWTSYMKSFATEFPPDDFAWPESTEIQVLSVEDQTALGVPLKEDQPLEPVPLVFIRGQGPHPQSTLAPDEKPVNPFRPAGN